MHRHARRLSAAFAATLAVVLALSSAAAATRFSVSSQTMKMTWNPLEFRAPGVTVRCGVVVEGTLHARTFPKIIGNLVGNITTAFAVRPCTNGTAWIYNGSEANEILGGVLVTSLPWHVTYEGFVGTLPRPGRVKLSVSRARFMLRATVFGVTLLCVYTTGTNGIPVFDVNLSEATGEIQNVAAEGSIRSETGGCPSGTLGGSGRVEVPILGHAITVTLI